MNIGINASFLSYPKSGVGQYTKHIIQQITHLDKHNHYILYTWDKTLVLNSIISPDTPNMSLRYVGVLYKRQDLFQKFWWEKFSLPKEVNKKVKKGQAKNTIDLFWTPYLSVSQFKKIPHIMTVHDVVHKAMPEYIQNSRWAFYLRQAEKAVKKANSIITISQFSKKEIQNYLNISKDKISVIPLAPTISKKIVQETLTIESLKQYILYVGGLDVRKNIRGLLEAYVELRKQCDLERIEAPRLMITGNSQKSKIIPDLAEIMTLLNLRGDNDVVLTGHISDGELYSLYKGASVIVYPSLYEGFGLPILEGMKFGVPVITSNRGAMKEVAGKGAILVNPKDTIALAEAMHQVLTNSTYSHDMTQRGFKRVGDFNWKKTAQETLKTFKQTLHK